MELTNEKIKIQFQALLNKPMDSITSEDLDTIKVMAINSKGLPPAEAEKNVIEVMKACKKLEELNFTYTFITKAIVEELGKTSIKRLGFSNCAFEDEDNVVFAPGVNYIKMHNCFLDNYEHFLTNLPETLETLYIAYPSDEAIIKTSILKRLKALKRLILDGCIVQFDDLNLPECDYLSLLGTEINSESAKKISTMPKLQKMFISRRFNELDEINELSKKIDIKNDLSEYVYEEEPKKL